MVHNWCIVFSDGASAWDDPGALREANRVLLRFVVVLGVRVDCLLVDDRLMDDGLIVVRNCLVVDRLVGRGLVHYRLVVDVLVVHGLVVDVLVVDGLVGDGLVVLGSVRGGLVVLGLVGSVLVVDGLVVGVVVVFWDLVMLNGSINLVMADCRGMTDDDGVGDDCRGVTVDDVGIVDDCRGMTVDVVGVVDDGVDDCRGMTVDDMVVLLLLLE